MLIIQALFNVSARRVISPSLKYVDDQNVLRTPTPTTDGIVWIHARIANLRRSHLQTTGVDECSFHNIKMLIRAYYSYEKELGPNKRSIRLVAKSRVLAQFRFHTCLINTYPGVPIIIP